VIGVVREDFSRKKKAGRDSAFRAIRRHLDDCARTLLCDVEVALVVEGEAVGGGPAGADGRLHAPRRHLDDRIIIAGGDIQIVGGIKHHSDRMT